jgi:hypothetical protein
MDISTEKKENKLHVTVDLGKSSTARTPRKMYYSDDICELLAENDINLKGYTLESGTYRISKFKGKHVGFYVFSRNSKTSNPSIPVKPKAAKKIKKSSTSTGA